MNNENLKRSGQIPEFGNWDYANDLPITQYFESAHQAGLLRHSSFSGEVDLYDATSSEDNKDRDLLRPIATKVKEQSKKQRKVFDVAEPQPSMRRRRQGKAVDEDLYKIPPDDLLYAKPKQKKMLGFIIRCLVPSCSV